MGSSELLFLVVTSDFSGLFSHVLKFPNKDTHVNILQPEYILFVDVI